MTWPAQAIKICGVRTPEHASVAASAGADYIGMILAPGRRQIKPPEARAIAAAIRAGGFATRLVGVFVNAPATVMLALVREIGLDAVQLSGDEAADAVPAMPVPLIKALRLDGSLGEAAWIERAQSEPEALRLVIDAHVPGSYGGAGVLADWGRAAEVARQTPTLLAGGLDPTNVAAAISTVRPWGVDVSSGVETAYVKDSDKIIAFIAAARAAWTVA